MSSCIRWSRGARALLSSTVIAGSFACTPPESPALELWAAGREGEVVAQLIPEFEAQNPGVHVHVQQLPWRGAHEKLLTAVVGESTPDVAPLGNTWIPEFAMIGALDTLDDRVSRSAVVQAPDYFPGVWDTNRFEGHLYGVPWYVDTRILFYRRDLLAEAGFPRPPETWSEWLAMLRALKARFEAHGQPGHSPFYYALYEPELVLALGLQQGPLLRDGNRFGNFESEGFVRALGFYAELFQAGLAPRAGITQIGNLWDEFARGNFVFYMSGPWQLGELDRRLPPELAESWTTAPLPGREGPDASLAYGSSLVVFSGSKKKEAAWKLVEYLSRPEVQRRFYALTGDLPPRRSSWQGSDLEADPHTVAFRSQLERVEPTPSVPEWERIASEVAIVSERAARGNMTVAEAARELDARADRILEKRRWLLERHAAIGTSAASEQAPGHAPGEEGR